MNFSISVNHKYTKYAYVMLTSLFIHHKAFPRQLTVYILQSDLTDEDIELFLRLAVQYGQTIIFQQVDIGAYAADLPTTKNWSKEMYYRLLLGELLPEEISRILYLDVDIIVNQQLFSFYQIDLQGKDLAAADDPMIQGNFSAEQQRLFEGLQQPVRYFNSGVILYDLKKIRKSYSFATYCDVARRFSYQLTNPDQDLLNYVHAGNVYYIDNSHYNIFAQIAEMQGSNYEQVKTKGAIIHFAGRKPWNYNGIHYGTEKLWWDYAKQTPFYYELMEPVFLQGLEDASYDSMMALLKENGELKQSLEETMVLCRKLLGMVNG